MVQEAIAEQRKIAEQLTRNEQEAQTLKRLFVRKTFFPTGSQDVPCSLSLSPLPKLDISYSPDGVLVASPGFKAVVDESGATGLDFRLLRSGFFAVRSIAAVPFDAERRRTRFENRCEVCGQFDCVVGATPVFLKADARVPETGFVRTDLEFGSDDEKCPLELCGDDIGARLRRTKLRGIDLMAAEQRSLSQRDLGRRGGSKQPARFLVRVNNQVAPHDLDQAFAEHRSIVCGSSL